MHVQIPFMDSVRYFIYPIRNPERKKIIWPLQFLKKATLRESLAVIRKIESHLSGKHCEIPQGRAMKA